MCASVTLRIHCLQQWYGLERSGDGGALYEIASMWRFAGRSLLLELPRQTRRQFRASGTARASRVGPSAVEATNRHLPSKGLMH